MGQLTQMQLVYPALLRGEPAAWFERAAADLLATSTYRAVNGHAATVSDLVAGRLALPPEWSVMPLRSGTDALVRALRMLGAGPAREVIVPDLAFHAVGAAVLEVGAVPVVADISADDWNIAPTDVANLVNDATAAVVAVDNYGTPVDLRPLAAITRSAGVPLVLDACESLGVVHPSGGPARHADLIVTSFSFTKPVHAAGMGGALAGPRAVLDESWASPALLGPQRLLPELNAAYLVAAWPSLESNLARLRAVHRRYVEVGSALGLEPQGGVPDSTRLHPVLCVPERLGRAGRDQLVDRLADMGIPTRAYFPSQSRLLGLGLAPPVSASIADRVLCLPGGVAVPEWAVDRVTRALAHVGHGP